MFNKCMFLLAAVCPEFQAHVSSYPLGGAWRWASSFQILGAGPAAAARAVYPQLDINTVQHFILGASNCLYTST